MMCNVTATPVLLVTLAASVAQAYIIVLVFLRLSVCLSNISSALILVRAAAKLQLPLVG